MLALYLAALGFGSSLIVASLFFGGGDKDFDKDFDLEAEADFDADVDAEVDLEVEADVEAEFDAEADVEADGDLDKDLDVAAQAAEGLEAGSDAIWLPFLSMRFWTFGTATFGLAGTLLDLLSVHPGLTLAVALLMGGGLGTGAAWFFKKLKTDTVSGETTLSRFAGEEARVLLPIRPGMQGKIVVETLAGRVEMLASTRDREEIERGSTVIIADVRGGVADVSQLEGSRRTGAGISQAGPSDRQRAAQAQERARKDRSDT